MTVDMYQVLIVVALLPETHFPEKTTILCSFVHLIEKLKQWHTPASICIMNIKQTFVFKWVSGLICVHLDVSLFLSVACSRFTLKYEYLGTVMPAACSQSFVRRRTLKLLVYFLFTGNLVNAQATDARSNITIKSLHALLIPQRVYVGDSECSCKEITMM